MDFIRQRPERQVKERERSRLDCSDMPSKLFSKTVKSQKQKKYLEVKQKEGRNINSNIFRAMVKYFLSEPCKEDLLQKVIQSHHLQITPEEFQKIVKQQTRAMKTHVKNSEILKFCRGTYAPNAIEFNQVARIMIRIYLRKVHFLSCYNSKKMQKETRPLHLKFAASLLSSIEK